MIALDLGSNTVRILHYDCENGKQLFSYEKVVKTADGLAKTGQINDDAIQRVIDAVKQMQEEVDFSVAPIRAVTTEAVRRASNSDEVLAKIRQATGVSFEMISGDEEAKLTLLAAKNRLEKLRYASDTFVLVDIGGGSTELIFHYGEETISKSFPVGIVTIAQTYETLEKIEEVLPKEMSTLR